MSQIIRFLKLELTLYVVFLEVEHFCVQIILFLDFLTLIATNLSVFLQF
jgi:hypothetical protein